MQISSEIPHWEPAMWWSAPRPWEDGGSCHEGWALPPHPLSPTQQGLPSFLILPMYRSSYFTLGLNFSHKTKSDIMHSVCASLWSMLMSVTADVGRTGNGLRDRCRHQPESSINIKLYYNRGASTRELRRGFLETVLTQEEKQESSAGS